MSGESSTSEQAERDRLFSLSLDMLCVAGFDGRLKQVNPAWTRTLGWSEAELLALSWKDLVHPEDRRATRAAGVALFSGRPTACFENRYRCKNGSYRWLSWNAHPLVDERTVVAVVRDITGQKAAEAARLEVEARVRESQKLEALRTLAGGMAHDFNNLLAAVLGNAALALEEVGDAHPARERLQQIATAGRRAGELVGQILAFSKSSSPVAEAEAACAAAAPQAEVQHVLYVDDDETVMILMNALLQRAGYRVTCHSDPLAAVSAVRARPETFDLIITDFNMPALTGLDLAADVARIRADLPVVIHTGHVCDAVRHEAARIGVRSVVHKGGSFDELGTVVHGILGAGRTTH
ncbi:Sensor histidine kinase TmoS [Burkholderiaceae bacterium]|nr:Sensor histidine kinase TmoS [Burkholderiaceae bacterium]